jgi:hypothetical protein
MIPSTTEYSVRKATTLILRPQRGQIRGPAGEDLGQPRVIQHGALQTARAVDSRHFGRARSSNLPEAYRERSSPDPQLVNER